MAKHEEYLWKDPFERESEGAVLLSDQIQFLAEEVGLIDPFDEKYIRPAAYDLRVGSSYYIDDVRKDLNDELIEIPPNGLVYVRTKEKFNIPYYLVARYSLRVHQVYRGLLIDNGLHIDPGYCGYIWIPVHNFTTQPRLLPQGQEFISIEFNRTTGLPKHVERIRTQDELVSIGLRHELTGAGGRCVRVFYRDLESYRTRHEDFTPRKFWDKFLGETHQSGMLGTERRLDALDEDLKRTVAEFQTEVRRTMGSFRNVGFIALVGLVVGLLAIVLPILYAEWGTSRAAEAEHTEQIRTLQQRLQEQKARLDAVVPTPGPGTLPKPIPQKAR